MRSLLPLLCWSLAAGLPAAELAHPLPDPGDQAKSFGAHVQRAMTLLATSTKEHRHHLRVLVYGQSISEGAWWHLVEADLRARFPDADLEMVNRAIGGHASQWLVREAETDVYPFHPDLILFHVYGAHTCYEQIVARMRSRTTAEVLITEDHLGGKESPNAAGVIEDDTWTRFMDTLFIPKVAERYGCELVALREPWKRYVLDNRLRARELLVDDIHLGDQGNALYAAMIERQLVYRPELQIADADAVRTLAIGKDLSWQDGKLTLAFEGNRVDALASGGKGPAATVLVDGKPPSQFAEAFAFTRAECPGAKIRCIASQRAPLAEDWTIRVTGVDRAAKSIAFEAIGAKTGRDGSGTSAKRFVSNSGRLVIEASVEKPFIPAESDWAIDFNQLKAGAEIRFSCYALHTDRYLAPVNADSSLENATTLVHSIANGKHTLTLTAEGPGEVPLQALRVYRPPVATPTKWVYDEVHPGR
jgi:hypothetical protein